MNDSLRSTLTAVAGLANAYLENLGRRGDDWLVLTSPVDHDGKPNAVARDKIVMAVHNLTQETVLSTHAAVRPGGAAFATTAPPLYLDVHLVFVANFEPSKYADGLAALSRLIGFFQQTPVFTPQTMPGLAPEIDKIALQLENLDPADVRHVTDMLGVPYRPSVFYKLRMLPFTSAAIRSPADPVAPG